MNASIICDDVSRGALFLSNGMVIDKVAYRNYGQLNQVATLRQTDQNGIYAIIGTKSSSVIGYYNGNTNTPTYTVNQNNNSVVNMGGGLNNIGLQQQPISNGLGEVTSGSVSIDSLLGSTTHTADVSNANTAKVEEPVTVEYIDGYKFLPIPTHYTDVVTEMIGGGKAKWKIKIKKDKENVMGGVNKHEQVYAELENKAKPKEYKITEITDDSVVLYGPSSFATAYMLADMKKTNNTIITGEQYFGYYDSVIYVDDVAIFKNNPDIITNDALNTSLENKLISIARNTTDMVSWFTMAGKELSQLEKVALKQYIVELLIDNLTVVENELTFDSNFDPFKVSPDYLVNLIKDNIDDITLRTKYLNGFDAIYKRLTFIDNLKNYSTLLDNAPVSTGKHKLLKVGGIGEDIPIVISKDKEIDLELSKLLSDMKPESGVIDTQVFYQLEVNTPNTLGLVRAIFNNSITSTTDTVFNYTDYSSIGSNVFLLLVNSNILKVIKTDTNVLVRKI